MKTSEKFCLTPEEAAQYIGIGENKIRTLCSAGILRAARNGRKWIIPKPMLERYVMTKAEKGEQI